MKKIWAPTLRRLCASRGNCDRAIDGRFCPASRADVSVGQPAPALTVAELDGTPFKLADHRGKVVIVNMWATWCGPCRLEMPALDTFYQQHKGHGIEMIGLSADRPADRKAVVKAMAAFSYPAAMLDDAHPNGFGSPAALPTTYVIGPDGIVRAQLKPSNIPITVKDLEGVTLSSCCPPSRVSPLANPSIPPQELRGDWCPVTVRARMRNHECDPLSQVLPAALRPRVRRGRALFIALAPRLLRLRHSRPRRRSRPTPSVPDDMPIAVRS